MRPGAGVPDPAPPGLRAFGYGIFCWANRHPGFMRGVGAILRVWTSLSHVVPVAARRSAVRHVLGRTRSFSNTAHQPNLVAAEFLIGMDPGPTYRADDALFKTFLARLHPQADADSEAQARCAALRTRAPGAPFDLVEDYLMAIVFQAIRPAFGSAADGVVAGQPGLAPDPATTRHYLHEIRHVAAQLFAGGMSPVAVRRRAELSAASLRARIDAMLPALRLAWTADPSISDAALHRNAVGLAWVSHPVTVQSGALAMQELLGRPAVYSELSAQAGALGEKVWTDPEFRRHVRDHLLELMRFRPVFPLLARDVPRDTEFESGARTNPKCPAGSSVTVLSISALFDPRAMDQPARFCPQRPWGAEADARYLMFGLGDRQCPARDHAVEILTSALIGLMTLPRLEWADRLGSRIGYDGPMINRMRLRSAPD